MNPDISKLHPYPFERLNALTADLTPPADLRPIALSIGEPRHAAPTFIAEELASQLHLLSRYPTTKGTPELRHAIAAWLTRRFGLEEDRLDPNTHVLPVNGTREALFAFAQAMIDRSSNPLVLMPNPFYQIYEGAALLAGAEPWFMNTTSDTRMLPDVDNVPTEVWQRCQLLYICTPGNPGGAVIDVTTLQKIIALADEHDFIIASDECYSEIYPDEANPPAGLLQAAAAMGRHDYARCVVFNSLSKRSNLPGLRSGLVAGDAQLIAQFLKYRTYHGSAMPMPTQMASIKAWQDETHVIDNRARYNRKYEAVLDILAPAMQVERPAASFYLWPETPIAETNFSAGLYARHNVMVLPGSYLSRDAHGINPGQNRVRMALVPPEAECVEAATRIREYINSL